MTDRQRRMLRLLTDREVLGFDLERGARNPILPAPFDYPWRAVDTLLELAELGLVDRDPMIGWPKYRFTPTPTGVAATHL